MFDILVNLSLDTFNLPSVRKGQVFECFMFHFITSILVHYVTLVHVLGLM
jgi:hypothetical protein